MWDLKNETNAFIYKTEGLTDVENLWLREREGGIEDKIGSLGFANTE